MNPFERLPPSMAGQAPVKARIVQQQEQQKAQRKGWEQTLSRVPLAEHSDHRLYGDEEGSDEAGHGDTSDDELPADSSELQIMEGPSSARPAKQNGKAAQGGKPRTAAKAASACKAIVPAKRDGLATSWRPGKRVSRASAKSVRAKLPGAKHARALQALNSNQMHQMQEATAPQPGTSAPYWPGSATMHHHAGLMAACPPPAAHHASMVAAPPPMYAMHAAPIPQQPPWPAAAAPAWCPAAMGPGPYAAPSQWQYNGAAMYGGAHGMQWPHCYAQTQPMQGYHPGGGAMQPQGQHAAARAAVAQQPPTANEPTAAALQHLHAAVKPEPRSPTLGGARVVAACIALTSSSGPPSNVKLEELRD